MIDNILNKTAQDREDLFLKVLDLAKIFWGDRLTQEQYAAASAEISDPDSRWMNIINHALTELHPNVVKTTLLNLGYEAFFRGAREIRKNRQICNCNIPWLILFDPTSACNMHCAGCWAGTYGDRFQLSFEDMDHIVKQGKKLGIYLYMMTGGEPLVRKKDILRLAEKHSDVQFAVYTNATLIDDAFCKEVIRLGNLAFFLSVEGDREANDSRRGDGHYRTVMQAMEMLKEYGILFGTSVCYTAENIYSVTSDDFLQMLSDKGAKFGFFFHYMPVGNDAVPSLLPSADQRAYIISRFSHIRSKDCNIPFFPIDFQNDGKYVGGCIAGGRNYFHINAAGDAEPCVFIHYSTANIHSSSLLEILQSPLFMAYYENQPFNDNHLMPCPMLENPDALKRMVDATKAKNTDFGSPESVEHLCEKCHIYADQWRPTAERLWRGQK